MSFSTALDALALVLAILAAIPPLRSYFLLNIAVGCVALAAILASGVLHP